VANLNQLTDNLELAPRLERDLDEQPYAEHGGIQTRNRGEHIIWFKVTQRRDLHDRETKVPRHARP
jgi:hypothetical protein